FAYLLGSAVLSLLVFMCAASSIVWPATFLVLGIAANAFAVWRSLGNRGGENLPPLNPVWRGLLGLSFTLFGLLYFTYALAPEMSPDGSSYHLGIVYRYLRQHGFGHITTNM